MASRLAGKCPLEVNEICISAAVISIEQDAVRRHNFKYRRSECKDIRYEDRGENIMKVRTNEEVSKALAEHNLLSL